MAQQMSEQEYHNADVQSTVQSYQGVQWHASALLTGHRRRFPHPYTSSVAAMKAQQSLLATGIISDVRVA